MASLFTHAIAGAVIGQAGKPAWRKDWRFWSVVVAFSLLPDIDSIGFHLGVPYGALWGHRGMTHSLLFAFVLATLAAMWLDGRFHRQWEMAILFFVAMASHGVLDAMTNGGLGVAFFSPLDTQRYFLPWRPILVSPIGVRGFFSPRGLKILGNEALWIWCPALILFALIKLLQQRPPIQAPDSPLGNTQN